MTHAYENDLFVYENKKYFFFFFVYVQKINKIHHRIRLDLKCFLDVNSFFF